MDNLQESLREAHPFSFEKLVPLSTALQIYVVVLSSLLFSVLQIPFGRDVSSEHFLLNFEIL